MQKIRGLEELSAQIRDQLPERAAPKQERDPVGAAVDGLFDLWRLCAKEKASRLPFAIQDKTKRVTFLLSNAGLIGHATKTGA